MRRGEKQILGYLLAIVGFLMFFDFLGSSLTVTDGSRVYQPFVEIRNLLPSTYWFLLGCFGIMYFLHNSLHLGDLRTLTETKPRRKVRSDFTSYEQVNKTTCEYCGTANTDKNGDGRCDYCGAPLKGEK